MCVAPPLFLLDSDVPPVLSSLMSVLAIERAVSWEFPSVLSRNGPSGIS